MAMRTPITRARDVAGELALLDSFFLVHLLCFAVIFTGITWTAVALFVVMFFELLDLRDPGGATTGTSRTSRTSSIASWQFVFAFMAQSSVQKGVLWWAANHRHHHRYLQTPNRTSTRRSRASGGATSAVSSDKYKATDYAAIKDFGGIRLVWLNKHDWIGPWAFGVTAFVVGGWPGLVGLFLVHRAAVAHHVPGQLGRGRLSGRRRYETEDTSRNSLLIVPVTGGRCWHNNQPPLPGVGATGASSGGRST